jgi:hypothetical protein
MAVTLISTPAAVAVHRTVDSESGSAQTAAEALDAQQEKTPGRVVGNRIYYPDGEVFVAVDAGTLSIGQCSSGQLCLWSFSNYSGSFSYKTGSGVTRTISTSVGSFYNNRSNAARLYSNTGASSVCYGPGAQLASVSSSYNSPAKVYLSATSSC